MEDQPKKRTVLIHHHIFKNAGTSFNYALKRTFSNGFFEHDLSNSQVVTSKNLANYLENNKKAVAVSGHHICFPTPQTEEFQTLSSVLIRHPLARVRSIYEFERKQDAQTEGAIMAKKLNFKDFVSWRLENASHVFCNYQTLYCSRTDNIRSDYSPTRQNLEIAKENLRSCLAIGTVERYTTFLMMAQYEGQSYFPDIIFQNAHLNITSKAEVAVKQNNSEEALIAELGADLVEKLEEFNQLDDELYEFTNNRIDEWLSQDTQIKADYFQSVGQYLAKNLDWRNAKVWFQNSILLDAENFQSYYGLGESLERSSDVDSAIAYYKKTIQRNSRFPWSYFRLGEILHKRNKLVDAEKYYRLAISNHIHEKSIVLYIALANCLIDQDRINETLFILDRASQVPNKLDRYESELINLYRRCGRTRES